eukprot:9809131-Alexandrium_andersonii.AAC.1
MGEARGLRRAVPDGSARVCPGGHECASAGLGSTALDLQQSKRCEPGPPPRKEDTHRNTQAMRARALAQRELHAK